MREILFRGMTAFHGWKTGCIDTAKTGTHGWLTILENDEHGHRVESWSVLKSTIGQYIGLRDKNGTRIFEGDTFEVTDGDGWVVGAHEAKIDGDTLSIHQDCIGEIIGNIHEREDKP